MEPLFFDTTTATGHFLIAIGKRNVAQRLRCEHGHLMERLRTVSPQKTGQLALPRAAPTSPLLPKDRAEQAFALGLFFSVGTLGCGGNLARLLTASAADDLV